MSTSPSELAAVACDGYRTRTECLDLARDDGCTVAFAIHAGNGRAFASEAQRSRASDSACGAGHERDASVKTSGIHGRVIAVAHAMVHTAALRRYRMG